MVRDGMVQCGATNFLFISFHIYTSPHPIFELSHDVVPYRQAQLLPNSIIVIFLHQNEQRRERDG